MDKPLAGIHDILAGAGFVSSGGPGYTFEVPDETRLAMAERFAVRVCTAFVLVMGACLYGADVTLSEHYGKGVTVTVHSDGRVDF